MLIGSEDLQARPLQRGDPRVLELNGAFNVGNRGMVEFIEVFKNETEYLHTMITATQEKFVPAPGRHGTIYVDTCIVAHSNEAEWQKFKADYTNEAILDRIVVVKVPYNLRLSEEVKIYQKFLAARSSTPDRAAHARDRLDVRDPDAARADAKCDLMTKLKPLQRRGGAREGAHQEAHRASCTTTPSARAYRISTRFIMKALDNALSQNPKSIHPISVREALIGMVKEADLAEDVKKQYLEFLQDTLHKVYLELLEKDITKAFVYSFGAGRDAVPELPRPRRGLRHQDQGARPQHPRGAAARRGVPQVDRGADRDHRLGGRRLPAGGDRLPVGVARRGERITYTSYEPLKEAIERKLMNSVREHRGSSPRRAPATSSSRSTTPWCRT